MFHYRDHCEGDVGTPRVDVAFTDASVDLQGCGPRFHSELPPVERACGVHFARLHQEHGAQVLIADGPGPGPQGEVPVADALVTTKHGLGLMIRAADCIPIVLADPTAGVVGAVHAGRAGVALDVVARAVERMESLGARQITAWIGPHVCGGCYEVPESLRAQVAAQVPETYAQTTWGTPSLDLGAGVRAQLETAGVEMVTVEGCTVETPGLHSYRRDGDTSGRHAGLVWIS